MSVNYYIMAMVPQLFCWSKFINIRNFIQSRLDWIKFLINNFLHGGFTKYMSNLYFYTDRVVNIMGRNLNKNKLCLQHLVDSFFFEIVQTVHIYHRTKDSNIPWRVSIISDWRVLSLCGIYKVISPTVFREIFAYL